MLQSSYAFHFHYVYLHVVFSNIPNKSTIHDWRDDNNSKSKDLLDNDKIGKDENDKICPKGYRPWTLCGNPKIHKPVVNNLLKFRLILSAINTPGYNLAKFLILILEPLNRNEFIWKDSFSFAKEITTYDRSYDSSYGWSWCSVLILLTDIPLNETINNCLNDLHNKKLYNGKLSKRDLFKLLETATSESSFIFDYLCFINKLTECQWVLLCVPPLQMHYEKEWLDNCPIHFSNKCLKFTSEVENDNSFSFLEIKITRHNQQFKTCL